MEMNQLVAPNTITNEVEEEGSPTCPNGKMTKLDDEKESMVPKTTCLAMTNSDETKKGMKLMTTRSKMGSNDVNTTPINFCSILHIRNRDKQYC